MGNNHDFFIVVVEFGRGRTRELFVCLFGVFFLFALYMLGKHSTTKRHPYPQSNAFYCCTGDQTQHLYMPGKCYTIEL
jgi:hypothetical protein